MMGEHKTVLFKLPLSIILIAKTLKTKEPVKARDTILFRSSKRWYSIDSGRPNRGATFEALQIILLR